MADIPTSPILSLPFDILHVIFLMCNFEQSVIFGTTASHVCRRWRSAAIASCALWSSITFSDQCPSWDKYAIWLTRSQDAPLSIEIGQQPFTNSSIKTLRRILGLILPHTARLFSISMRSLPNKILRIAIDRIRVAPLPILNTLKITATVQDISTWRPTHFVHGTLALRHVDLEDTPLHLVPSIFSNLTTLKIKLLTLPRTGYNILLRSILARSPNLYTLQIYPSGASSPSTTGMSSTPLIHHHLHILRTMKYLVEPFIQEVQAPALVQMTDRHGSYPLSLPLSALSAFARWLSQSKLESAKFSGDEDSHLFLRYLPAALNVLAALEDLEFHGVDFGNDQKILACLGGLCPRLKFIEIRECRGVTGTEISTLAAVRLESDVIAHLDVLLLLHLQAPMDGASKSEMESMGYLCESGRSTYRWTYYLPDENRDMWSGSICEI